MAKRILLRICKLVGLFRLSKYLTRSRLRILCYHHFSTDDKLDWSSRLFIRPDTLKKRMQYLKKAKFNVLGLNDAIDNLSRNELPAYATVITVDDGWYHTLLLAHDIFKRQSFPYTIYVSSYYSKQQSPLFNISIRYMFRNSEKTEVDIKRLGLPFGDVIRLSHTHAVEETTSQIIEYGYAQLNDPQRNNLLKQIGVLLDVDFKKIDTSRIFHFLSASEIKQLVNDGVDIQLHTYRHCWPLDRESALKELSDDRAFLEPIVGKHLEHFCYPSGEWTIPQLAFLREADIKSATTCDMGFNNFHTNRLILKRFLDSENIHPIEFEAIMCGFLELTHLSRNKLSLSQDKNQ